LHFISNNISHDIIEKMFTKQRQYDFLLCVHSLIVSPFGCDK
jgi:hypothetical protein